MRNFYALILLIWRIWTCNKSRSLMRVPVPRRISADWRWIFLLSVFLRDRLRFHNLSAYARVGALCVKSRAERKNTSHNCCNNFQIFDFHTFVFQGFAAGDSGGCSRRQIQKRFEELLRDPACFLQLA
jgi:hypothetical protein